MGLAHVRPLSQDQVARMSEDYTRLQACSPIIEWCSSQLMRGGTDVSRP